MESTSSHKTVVAVVALIIVAVGMAVFLNRPEPVPEIIVPEVVVVPDPLYKKIGTSVQGRAIDSYTYGKEGKLLVFVGGIHGGYEWNSVALAYKFMDYLKDNPDTVPAGLRVTVIPNLNPDAVYRVTGKEGRFALTDVSTDEKLLASARFNANGIDLNRNFDCKWQAKSTWRAKTVSAGTAPFSEPEAIALKNFVAEYSPDGVVFWHSQANAVYASQCDKGILPVTLSIMDTYSKASGYPAIKTFDSYVVTGAAEDWLASINIPAITVELKTHETLDWEKNLAGVKSLFDYFSPKKI